MIFDLYHAINTVCSLLYIARLVVEDLNDSAVEMSKIHVWYIKTK